VRENRADAEKRKAMDEFSTESTASTGIGHDLGHRGYSPAVHEEPRRQWSGGPITAASPLTCIECSRPWLDGRERWRLKVTEDTSRETVPYCHACWSREFED
jgi:hypothetical protein